MAQPADRRIVEIDEALRILEATSGLLPQTGFIRDASRAAQNRQQALGNPGRITRGVVVGFAGMICTGSSCERVSLTEVPVSGSHRGNLRRHA